VTPATVATAIDDHAQTQHGMALHALDGVLHSGTEVLPTPGQKNALSGTQGTPGSLNPYVTTQDARLSDPRTPTAHGHAQADISGLVAALAGKADTGHTHAVYAAASHSHVDADLPAGLTRDAEAALAYAPLGHTHPGGGGGPTIVRLTNPAVAAVTAFADIPGFVRALLANEAVHFRAVLVYRANATTTGVRLGVNGPASPAVLAYRTTTARTNALQSAAGATDNETSFMSQAYDAPAADSGVAAANTDYLASIEGIIVNGANAGNLAMRFASEVAVANGITLRPGSFVAFTTL
jgi:hypothetical protein